MFGSSEREALAQELLLMLERDLKPQDTTEGAHRLSINRATRQLERVYRRAGEHQRDNKMSYVGRALLAHSFKWGMINRGYSREFADAATEGLIVELERQRGTQAPPKKEKR